MMRPAGCLVSNVVMSQNTTCSFPAWKLRVFVFNGCLLSEDEQKKEIKTEVKRMIEK